MGYRRTELLVKRFPSGISSTTHLPPLYLVCSQYEILVLSEFGDCDTASEPKRYTETLNFPFQYNSGTSAPTLKSSDCLLI
jgi:hypothetical protein